MKSKMINDAAERVFVLILDQGEEAFKAITEFADRERVTGASVSAIGAFSQAKVGWFDFAAKKYKPIEVGEQCEVLSLLGDVRKAMTARPACIFTPCWVCRTARCAAATFCPARSNPRSRSRSLRPWFTCAARSGRTLALR